jgi:Mg-chelatase subunit ChlD
VVDDNAAFAEYQAFRNRTPVRHEALDIRTRRLVEVKDARGQGVADAELRITAPNGQSMWARTDAAGRVWVHTDSLDGGQASAYQVTARTTEGEATAIVRRGDKMAVELRLEDARFRFERARLDLVFVIDATGSMADEIAKLKTSLHQIATDVARLPARPDVCFAYVAYRDRGDEYVWRAQDFTNDLNFFQRSLADLQAGGGGDYPEAMSEALHESVHNLSWRGGRDLSVQRMAILLADAPPQLGSDRPNYAQATQAALGKGIKFYSVAASGLDKQGEFIQRQIAQYTGGKFVFLTYAQAHRPDSGPGRETTHDVQNYSVDTLDKLIVRLVKDELAPLGAGPRFGWNR